MKPTRRLERRKLPGKRLCGKGSLSQTHWLRQAPVHLHLHPRRPRARAGITLRHGFKSVWRAVDSHTRQHSQAMPVRTLLDRPPDTVTFTLSSPTAQLYGRLQSILLLRRYLLMLRRSTSRLRSLGSLPVCCCLPRVAVVLTVAIRDVQEDVCALGLLPDIARSWTDTFRGEW